jgi:hypothetical protein
MIFIYLGKYFCMTGAGQKNADRKRFGGTQNVTAAFSQAKSI